MSLEMGELFNSTIPSVIVDEVDPDGCRLLGPFAVIVQAGLAVIVLASLLVKRARERPRRPLKVWTADVAKQVLGQIFVHFTNIAVSDIGAKFDAPNPCSHYFLNILFDTTVGVFILYLILKALTAVCLERDPDSFKTGYYGRPFDTTIWAKQACVYVSALTLMKIVVVAFLLLVPGLASAASWILSWLRSGESQVLFAMLFTPIVMNVIQFIIIDSFLRSSVTPDSAPYNPDDSMSMYEQPGDDEERGLLGRSSTDEPLSPNPAMASSDSKHDISVPITDKIVHDANGGLIFDADDHASQPTPRRERSSSLQRKIAARERYPPTSISTVHREEESEAAPGQEDWGFDEDEDWDDDDHPPPADRPVTATAGPVQWQLQKLDGTNGEEHEGEEEDAWGFDQDELDAEVEKALGGAGADERNDHDGTTAQSVH